MRISDWSSDVCSSDLRCGLRTVLVVVSVGVRPAVDALAVRVVLPQCLPGVVVATLLEEEDLLHLHDPLGVPLVVPLGAHGQPGLVAKSRSEEHTSELQSLMRTSYADFCLNKKTT